MWLDMVTSLAVQLRVGHCVDLWDEVILRGKKVIVMSGGSPSCGMKRSGTGLC